jgi:hypothetical protein
MTQTAFDSSYTAMSADGAEWLVRHTGVRLVGIDALSIAAFADLVGPHDVLLGQARRRAARPSRFPHPWPAGSAGALRGRASSRWRASCWAASRRASTRSSACR